MDALEASSGANTEALGNSTATNLGGGSTYDAATGTISAPSYTVQSNPNDASTSTIVKNVGDAISSLNTAVTTPLTFKDATSGSSTNPLGSELAILGDSNITTTVEQGKATITLNKALNVDSVTAGDSLLNTDGLTVTGGPSITKAGINAAGTTISNVKDGVAGKDAVNKDQLDAVQTAVGQNTEALGNSLANNLGGGSIYDPSTGSISQPSYTVTSNPNDPTATTTVNNVGAALDSLNAAVSKPLMFTGDAGTGSSNVLGSTLEILGDRNITSTIDQGKAVLTLNKNITVDSVIAGASTLDNTGLTIAGGPSITLVGIDAGNKTITNVANAINAGDAVNKGQMDAAIDKVSSDVSQIAANAVQYDNADKNSITLGNPANGATGLHNVADGKLETGSKDAVNGGQLADIRDNLQGQITNNTKDITNIKNDLNSGAIGLVKQENPNADVTVAKDTGGTKVNVAGTDGNRVVTGVADGAINATSKDAVNGSQLHTNKVETNQKIVDYLGGGAAINNITGSFDKAPSYTVGDKTLNNVGSAIDALNQADQALNAKVDNVVNNMEQAFYNTNQRIDDVEKRANAGIAAAMALESAPYVPGKYTYAAGASYHGGENAIGVTLRKTADNGRWSLTGGIAAASEGDPSVRIGISGVID